jgi:hypothetical protein
MSTNEIGKFCSSCQTSVYDIHNKSLEEIHVLKTKNDDKICGRISKVQYEQFRFLHPMKRFAIALFLVFGTGLFTASYGQVVKETAIKQAPNYTTIVNIFAKSKAGKPLENVDISLTYNEDFIQGKTDATGKLVLTFHAVSTVSLIGFNIYYDNTYAYIEKQIHSGENRLENIIYDSSNGEMTIGEQVFHEEFLMGDVMIEEDWDH